VPEVAGIQVNLAGSVVLGVQVTVHPPTAAVPATTIAAVEAVIVTDVKLVVADGKFAKPLSVVNLATVSQLVIDPLLF
jgi:hypothetical protein